MAYLSSITVPNGTTYDLKDSDARSSLDTKQTQTFSTISTLYAANWNSNMYYFTSTYPTTDYDMMVELDGSSLTSDQLASWNKAQIIGISSVNAIKAFGTVPTIDIPIQLYIIPK